ncbi:MAG: tRNA (N(6)-L-threonylcarbamoyladenosine(37)-C(2))-methylthiotransferase MtaB [Chloroflexota bacterium]
MAIQTQPRVAFTTLGCKVNQSETDLYARQFVAAGFSCVPFEGPADVYVVNTCTVTHVADKKSRQLIHQARKSNPDALVVAAGCYASVVGEMLADRSTLVVRNRDKERLVSLVQGRLHRQEIDVPSFADNEKYLDAVTGQERTRAMVKVQDGCDSHCAYCIIPRARGRSRSVEPNTVVRRVAALVREGHAEVVVTGVDLGSYGEDAKHYPDLGGLLHYILERTEVRRVRVSSLEPADFRPEWLDLWSTPRLCRHLHVPLQSGSASVLQRMERRYTPDDFRVMVQACRAAVPGITITTDVITGFPGETEDEFLDGLDFIRSVAFDGMHVFKYSKRSGTRAARMPDHVCEDAKKERSRLLREEAGAGVERLVRRTMGMDAFVAWESERDGVWRGLTDSNVRAYGPSEGVRPGRLSHVRLSAPFRDGLWAEERTMDIPLAVRNYSTATFVDTTG